MNLMVVTVSYLLISIEIISIHFCRIININNCKLDRLYNEFFIIFEVKNVTNDKVRSLVLPPTANINSLLGRMRWSVLCVLCFYFFSAMLFSSLSAFLGFERFVNLYISIESCLTLLKSNIITLFL